MHGDWPLSSTIGYSQLNQRKTGIGFGHVKHRLTSAASFDRVMRLVTSAPACPTSTTLPKMVSASRGSQASKQSLPLSLLAVHRRLLRASGWWVQDRVAPKNTPINPGIDSKVMLSTHTFQVWPRMIATRSSGEATKSTSIDPRLLLGSDRRSSAEPFPHCHRD